jgi:flagellar biosynthesis/type III secretory pathway protein FliH
MSSFERWTMPEIVPGSIREVLPAAPAIPTPEDEAYARGYAEGYRTGLDEADRRVRTTCQALGGVMESLRAVQAAFAGEMEQTLTTLALALARQIVQRDVALDAAVVRDLVRRAVESIPLEVPLEIRLNPADLAALGTDLELYGAGGRRLDAHWSADAALERGSYVIETPHRVIDGELDAVLTHLYERLRDV